MTPLRKRAARRSPRARPRRARPVPARPGSFGERGEGCRGAGARGGRARARGRGAPGPAPAGPAKLKARRGLLCCSRPQAASRALFPPPPPRPRQRLAAPRSLAASCLCRSASTSPRAAFSWRARAGKSGLITGSRNESAAAGSAGWPLAPACRRSKVGQLCKFCTTRDRTNLALITHHVTA